MRQYFPSYILAPFFSKVDEPLMPLDPMERGYHDPGFPPNGNPDDRHPDSDGSTDDPSSGKRSNNDKLNQPVILGIVLGGLLLALAVLVALCWWKQQHLKRRSECRKLIYTVVT